MSHKRIASMLLVVMLLLTLAPVANAAIDTLLFTSIGPVTVTFDYNTNTGDVKRFTCTNPSDFDAWFGVYQVDPESGQRILVYERICAANGITVQVVAGLVIAWDIENGGLDMGNYQFRARWPN